MPIDIQCTACGQRLRVGDGLAGKQAQCPKCKANLTIPAAAQLNPVAKATAASAAVSNPAVTAAKAQSSGARVATATAVASPVKATPVAPAMPAAPVHAAPVAPPDEWHLQTPDGQSYGPISKAELEAWLAEDRITADSQLLPPGGQEWLAATLIYPSLAQMVAAPNVPATAMPPLPQVGPDPSSASYASVRTSGDHSAGTAGEIDMAATFGPLLGETRAWTMFISVVGFIGAGVTLLYGIVSMLRALRSIGIAPGIFIAMDGITGLITFGFGCLYVFIFIYLCTYSMRVGGFINSGAVRQLEAAFRAHRNFWRTAGTTMIVFMLLIVAGVILSLAGGIMAFANYSK